MVIVFKPGGVLVLQDITTGPGIGGAVAVGGGAAGYSQISGMPWLS